MLFCGRHPHKVVYIMRNFILNLVLLFAFSLSVFGRQDSVDADVPSGDPIFAGAIELEEQKVVFDSLVAAQMAEDEENEAEEDSLFFENWDNTKLNPYGLKVTEVTDSFVVDCSNFCPPTQNVVTSEFGPRWARLHCGIDLRVKVGDSIRAAFDGKVRIKRVGSRRKGYGYFVLLRHPNGLETLYAHLSKILVEAEQEVKAGEVIALGGNTGRSTGPHLHFETRYQGIPINPRNIIDFKEFAVYDDNYLVTRKGSFKEWTDYVNSPAKYYKVRRGDCLSKIAKRHRTTVKRICRLNRITTKTVLRPGRRLRVR